MDDADARPKQHVATGLAREIAAEVTVRAKDDFLVPGYLIEDHAGAARSDNDVAERLHCCRAVDVGKRDMVGVRCPESSELVGRAAVLKAATGVHVRQNYRLLGTEDLGRFSHE